MAIVIVSCFRKGGGQQCEACVEEGVVMEYSLISMEQVCSEYNFFYPFAADG